MWIIALDINGLVFGLAKKFISIRFYGKSLTNFMTNPIIFKRLYKKRWSVQGWFHEREPCAVM